MPYHSSTLFCTRPNTRQNKLSQLSVRKCVMLNMCTSGVFMCMCARVRVCVYVHVRVCMCVEEKGGDRYFNILSVIGH